MRSVRMTQTRPVPSLISVELPLLYKGGRRTHLDECRRLHHDEQEAPRGILCKADGRPSRRCPQGICLGGRTAKGVYLVRAHKKLSCNEM